MSNNKIQEDLQRVFDFLLCLGSFPKTWSFASGTFYAFNQSALQNCRGKFALGVSLPGTNPISELLVCFLAGHVWLKYDSGGWLSFRPVSEILDWLGKEGNRELHFDPPFSRFLLTVRHIEKKKNRIWIRPLIGMAEWN